jgi:hypothetical protein
MSAGKGDKPRPVNKKVFNKNFDLIKKSLTESKKELVKKKNGKTTYIYR